jgi:TrmH family RNA methyltransferase
VEPRYQLNLGYIARVSENFGVGGLALVNPIADKGGKRAIMYSKHAKDLLLGATVFSSLDDAIRDCSVVVGTTGIREKARRNFRNLLLLDDAIAKINKSRMRKSGIVGIVLGREGTGLSTEELEKCDMLVHIGANPGYPVLNVSHALAVLLYAFTKAGFSGIKEEATAEDPDRKELEFLFSTFRELISRKKIRNRRAVMNAFKRLIFSAQPTRREVHSLITALK